jgi:hypothetical protein
MPNSHTLDLFDGIKGGVGKSFLARTVLDWYIGHNLPFTPFETDRSNPDCKRIYNQLVEFQVGIFSEGEKFESKADNIITSAIENPATLVNLPAQSFQPIVEWLEKSDIFELVREFDVSLNVWFVSDGGFDSLNLLKKSLEYYAGRATHIVVKNHGRSEDWSGFEADKTLKKLLKTYDCPIIDFPRFPNSALRNFIDQESLPFITAQTYDFPEDKYINQSRVRKFRREAFAAIESAGVLRYEPIPA